MEVTEFLFSFGMTWEVLGRMSDNPVEWVLDVLQSSELKISEQYKRGIAVVYCSLKH